MPRSPARPRRKEEQRALEWIKLLWMYKDWAEHSVSCYWGSGVLTHSMSKEAPVWHWVVCAIGMVAPCANPASRIIVSSANYHWRCSFAKHSLSLWVQRTPPQYPLTVDKTHGEEGSLPLPQSCAALHSLELCERQGTMELNGTTVSGQSSGCRGRWRPWHSPVETKFFMVA